MSDEKRASALKTKIKASTSYVLFTTDIMTVTMNPYHKVNGDDKINNIARLSLWNQSCYQDVSRYCLIGV